MITRSLIESLQQQGVKFEVEGSKVKIKAPTGILTTELKAVLGTNKQYLAALLSRLSDKQHYWYVYHERLALSSYAFGAEENERLVYQAVLREFISELYPEIIAAFDCAINQPIIN